jgi:hypothetical protein
MKAGEGDALALLLSAKPKGKSEPSDSESDDTGDDPVALFFEAAGIEDKAATRRAFRLAVASCEDCADDSAESDEES